MSPHQFLKAQAHWLNSQTIVWSVNFGKDATYTLHYDPSGGLKIKQDHVESKNEIPLNFESPSLIKELLAQYPHLEGSHTLMVRDENKDAIPDVLRGQFVLSARDADGSFLDITRLHIPGVLDDLYYNDQKLGICWENDIPTIKVWAPTAKSVILLLFERTPNHQFKILENPVPMEWEPHTGIWSAEGTANWVNKYYQLEIEVFIHQEGKFVKNIVTDPYSTCLSINSTHSQIINLFDQDLMPAGWDCLEKPHLENFTDISLYELHLRDFSIRDDSIPTEHRGTYQAFSHADSCGMKHLKRLTDAGISHIHLMPVFDFGSVNEDKSKQITFDWEQITHYPPDSSKQQRLLQIIREHDGYNWGYDPLHFTVPEGSYSTRPDSNQRILEFREMVKSLNQMGLRVVIDVVYNHTFASGQDEKSVLDRIVPGYYHRLDQDGVVLETTCCPNTATEHKMMRKLMIDSVITWSKAYKIDGFRFDLMGHHMRSDMLTIREELDNLTIKNDGIDGSKILIYGEGWDFGEVANNSRGINASQINLAGTGIGTFNDRIRDAVRGGKPFGPPKEQGFVTGLYTNPNEYEKTSSSAQLEKLLFLGDLIRISLTGNLTNYPLITYQGDERTGSQIFYQDQPAGYNQSPQENIPYVSAHDNETLFDIIQMKAPAATSLDQRVKMQQLALSLVAFCQGIPFFHAGCELLRSKSLDRDSYNSTDWFNAIDWTLETNTWGSGLPPEDKNGANWNLIKPLLADESIVPTKDHMFYTQKLFRKYLKIRKSSPLFRLQTSEKVLGSLRFHNTGKSQIPGLIAMSLTDSQDFPIDPIFEVVLVLFNANPKPIEYQITETPELNLHLHPQLVDEPSFEAASFNHDTHTFSIPGISSAVFVKQK
jgi:pullulanase-type alpha-1,6-glucosidase